MTTSKSRKTVLHPRGMCQEHELVVLTAVQGNMSSSMQNIARHQIGYGIYNRHAGRKAVICHKISYCCLHTVPRKYKGRCTYIVPSCGVRALHLDGTDKRTGR